MDTFSIELIPAEMNDGDWDELNNLMADIQDANVKYWQELSKELNISYQCAMYVCYLRGRSRWTQEKENQLIKMDQAGETLPNVLAGDF